MKRIFTLLASFILTISLFAAARPKSQLTIRSADAGDIRVVIDGRRFEPNDNYMRIRDMQPGYHSVKIYRFRNTGFFTIFGNRYDMVFSNSMLIKPRSNVMISIDRFGRAQVLENRMNGRGYGWGDDDDRGWKTDHDYDFDGGHNFGDYGDRDHNWNDRDSHWGDRDNRHDNDGGLGNQGGGYGNNGGYGNQGGGYGNNGGYGNQGGYGTNGGYSKVMSDVDFNRVLDNISRERFEMNMMKSASQVISTSFFTSAQVRQMVQLFSSESNKLELAKQAYDKTVDQRNYSSVSDVFTYTTTKDELARYIRSH